MPQREQHGRRDLAYSAWHRRNSISLFMSIEEAERLHQIDLDCVVFVEWSVGTREPVALIEAARDVGQDRKTSSYTARIGERAGVPVFTVLYTLSEAPNPADPSQPDIESFRMRQVAPAPPTGWHEMTPHEYADFLTWLREEED